MGCALLLACSHAASRPAQTSVAPAASEPSPSAELLRENLAALSQELLAEGYRPTGEMKLGFVAPSTRNVEPVSIAPRTCVSVAAVATPSVSDLDAALYAADGTVLSEDDGPSARPVLRVCSGNVALTAYLVLFPFQGAGSYAAQRFERPVSALDAQADAAESVAVSPAFEELLSLLHRQGYRDETPLVDVPLVPGVGLRFAAKLLAGHCYSMLADGPHMRLRLLDAAGREIAVGIGDEAPAVLQHCAREDAELTLELSTRGRARTTKVARLFAPQLTVGGARAVWLGEPAPAWVSAPTQDAPVDASACQGHLSELLSRAPLRQGEVIERPLTASARCAVLEAELHEGLSRVTLRVESADGAVLGERELVQLPDAVRVCPAKPGQRVALLARAGFGALTLKQKLCR